MKEVEGPVEHNINLGTQALVLQELKVTSKLVKPKGKPGRKKKVDLEALEEEDGEGTGHPGGTAAGASPAHKY